MPEFNLANFMPNVFKQNGLKPIFFMVSEMPNRCSEALAHPKTQDLLNRKFDLVLVSLFFSDCYYSLIHQLQVCMNYFSLTHSLRGINDVNYAKLNQLLKKTPYCA